MLTNKKRWRKQIQILLMATALVWLAGCMPAGPRALLRGKRLIEQGKYSDAVEELKDATSLLVTNAQAWNYLGLAYHHAGQAPEAVDAYRRALKANPDLVIAHYNLGCQLLEMNRPDTLDAARNELTAFTLHQRNSTDGWLKLGTAQLRLADLTSAEASFRQVLLMNSQNAEAMNDLGLVQVQRRRPRDAIAYFTAALQKQPGYGPALLNLATVQYHQNNRTLALQKYQEYLASSPHDAKWDSVNAFAQQLNAELSPPPRPMPTNSVAATNPAPTNLARVEVAPAPKLKPTEPVRVAQNTVPAPQPVVAQTKPPTDTIGEPPKETTIAQPPPKKGFLTRLFHRGDKPEAATPLPPTTQSTPPQETATPAETTVITDPGTLAVAKPAPVRAISVPRYPYLTTGKPPAGNRAEAERQMARAAAAERDGQTKDAVPYYRAATMADPSFFDAQNALGTATAAVGDLGQALRAYEIAVMLNPSSFTARFNFGLTLKRANYIQDAAQELENLLAANPAGESPDRLAVVHLTLANLYSEQFHQPAAARRHYQKVLELDPHNSQATPIRFWLQNNP